MKSSRNAPDPARRSGIRRTDSIDLEHPDLPAGDLDRALELTLPLGVCCAEAQADGIPCPEPGSDCLHCERADPARQLLLRLAASDQVH